MLLMPGRALRYAAMSRVDVRIRHASDCLLQLRLERRVVRCRRDGTPRPTRLPVSIEPHSSGTLADNGDDDRVERTRGKIPAVDDRREIQAAQRAEQLVSGAVRQLVDLIWLQVFRRSKSV